MIQNKKLTHFTLLLLQSILIYSCSNVKRFQYEINLAPRVELPKTAKSIGLINRSIPNENIKKADKLEELLSQEGFGIDKKASNTSIYEMSNHFARNNFNCKLIDSTLYKSTALSQRPEALTWEKVNEICTKNKVDLLMVLEFFDTESSFTHSATPSVTTLPGGSTINTLKYTINVNTKMDGFWRIYDPNTKKIIDEYTVSDNVSSSGTGQSILAAYLAIKNREAEVLNRSRIISQEYAKELFIRKVMNAEYYYCKGSDKLIKASRMVNTKNITEANEVWKNEDSENKKIKGRALYNQALAQDSFENTDSAIVLARKSYEEYGEKRGMRLANSIQRRTPKKTNNVPSL